MAETTTDNLSRHPNPAPHPHHRKIELQSHADLTYLQQNLARAAREKLDLHFPLSAKQAAPAEVITLGGEPQPATESQDRDQSKNKKDGNAIWTGTGIAPEGDDEEEDPLRRHVRQLVDEFLHQTYTSASHSISVNGIDASSLPPSRLPSCSNPTPDLNPETSKPLEPSQEIEGIHYTYSAFDPRLQKRLASLHGELENLTAQVSKLRREAPRVSAEAYTSRLEAALARDEEEWGREQARLQSKTYAGLELDQMRDGWNEDVRSVYERGVGDLAVGVGGEGSTGTECRGGVRVRASIDAYCANTKHQGGLEKHYEPSQAKPSHVLLSRPRDLHLCKAISPNTSTRLRPKVQPSPLI